MTDNTKKCSNPECDACHPTPRWTVQTITVRRIAHEREIKASTREEALIAYRDGTAWPASYDERTLEVINTEETTAVQVTDEAHLRACRQSNCYLKA